MRKETNRIRVRDTILEAGHSRRDGNQYRFRNGRTDDGILNRKK